MKENADRDIFTISCDNDECSYMYKATEIEDYRQWINKTCPECGSILLTEDSYTNRKYMSQITKLANKVLVQKNDLCMNVAVDENGNIDFRIEKV